MKSKVHAQASPASRESRRPEGRAGAWNLAEQTASSGTLEPQPWSLVEMWS